MTNNKYVATAIHVHISILGKKQFLHLKLLVLEDLNIYVLLFSEEYLFTSCTDLFVLVF